MTFVLPFSEPSQNSVKYLTWHRTSSFRSSSSRNLLANDIADPSKILFDNFCMVSGSHASTLDRLYAWEKKLYDEVKVSMHLLLTGQYASCFCNFYLNGSGD